MANIIDKIAQIRQAVFGKDIRESMASGIDAINTELESTTNKQNILGSQFNSLVINAGANNAENVAARTSIVTGQTYDTMGHRIDSHDTQLADMSTQLEDININVRGIGFLAKGNWNNALNTGDDDTQIFLDIINYAKTRQRKVTILIPDTGKEYKISQSLIIDPTFISIKGKGVLRFKNLANNSYALGIDNTETWQGSFKRKETIIEGITIEGDYNIRTHVAGGLFSATSPNITGLKFLENAHDICNKYIKDVTVKGFSKGMYQNAYTWGITFENCGFWWNDKGVSFGDNQGLGGVPVFFNHCMFANNNLAIDSKNKVCGAFHFKDCQFEYNNMWIDNIDSKIFIDGFHYEADIHMHPGVVIYSANNGDSLVSIKNGVILEFAHAPNPSDPANAEYIYNAPSMFARFDHDFSEGALQRATKISDFNNIAFQIRGDTFTSGRVFGGNAVRYIDIDKCSWWKPYDWTNPSWAWTPCLTMLAEDKNAVVNKGYENAIISNAFITKDKVSVINRYSNVGGAFNLSISTLDKNSGSGSLRVAKTSTIADYSRFCIHAKIKQGASTMSELYHKITSAGTTGNITIQPMYVFMDYDFDAKVPFIAYSENIDDVITIPATAINTTWQKLQFYSSIKAPEWANAYAFLISLDSIVSPGTFTMHFDDALINTF